MINSIEHLKQVHQDGNEIEQVLKPKEFEQILDEDSKNKEENILIENNMLVHDDANINNLQDLGIQFNDNIGKHYNMIMINMISSMNITNELIVESNKYFKIIKEGKDKFFYFNTYCFNKVKKYNEYIIHDIKKYIEILLEVDWLLRNSGKYLKYDTLGQIVKNIENVDKHMNEFDKYKKYYKFFKCINEIDNSFKHSYVNDAALFIGREKNCITVIISQKDKNLQQNPEIGENIGYILLDNMIMEFNEFFKYAISNINENISKYGEEIHE